MYLDFFHFEREPFHITPDPYFFYESRGHKEALAALIYGVGQRKGFIALTGEVGVGKTTILRSFIEGIDRERTKVIYLLNSCVSFPDLLTMLLQEFGEAPESGNTFMMVNRLHRILIEQFRHGRNVALIVDEAQNMPVETLEHLRMLSNLETSTDKLVQIVLAGQPDLERVLGRNELRQLRQRIAVRATVPPLTKMESLDYIRHRLAAVAADGPGVFTGRALNRIVKKAGGIPRTINILCDNALITGYGYQKRPVDSRIVREVIRDLEGRKK